MSAYVIAGAVFGAIGVLFVAAELAARVSVTPVAPQQFNAVVSIPERPDVTYELTGDQLYVDAHILKWKPIVNILGLHTSYELDRVGGRYFDISQERHGKRTIYSLAPERGVNLFDLRQRYTLLTPLLDAEYGSATFVPVKRPAEFEVRVSTTGLLVREAPGAARPTPTRN
jgi:hypothetical protein